MNIIKLICIVALSITTLTANAANELIFSGPPKSSYQVGDKISFSWKHSEKKAPTLLAILKDGKRTIGLKLKKSFNSYSIPAESVGAYTVLLKGADGKVISKKFQVVKGQAVSKKVSSAKNEFELVYPIQDVILAHNQDSVTFKWKSKIDEPSVLFLKVRGKMYKLPIKEGETEKTIKVSSRTELQWWLGGKRTRTLSRKKSVTITESKEADKFLYAHFGIDTRSNSQSFKDENDPIEGVEGSVSFAGIEMNLFQRAYKSPLKCFPQGGFHYSTAMSSGEDEVSLEDFDAFGAEFNCAYALTPVIAAGPSLAVESLPFFIQKDNELEGGSFQAIMLGGRVDLNGKVGKNFGYLTGLSGHAASGVLKYAGNFDLIWDYFRFPLLLGVKYTNFTTSTDELEGYQSSILSTRVGFSIGF